LSETQSRLSAREASLTEKKAALQAFHEQIEFNKRARAEAERAAAAAAAATPQKKPSLLDSLAKKLKGADDASPSPSPEPEISVDMFSSPTNGLSNGVGAWPSSAASASLPKDAKYELAEEVAVSLSRRLQQSETERLALQQQLQQFKRQVAASSAPATPATTASAGQARTVNGAMRGTPQRRA
jgi:hypothetical protein